ncbi:MAG TPA: YaiO family outer membrane beta-barrel protein [Pyrinomonadaceae bacterium]|nr:YaiO family outer membrane beta-barrel protein [Pyrinomonadaceae bacterium]
MRWIATLCVLLSFMLLLNNPAWAQAPAVKSQTAPSFTRVTAEQIEPTDSLPADEKDKEDRSTQEAATADLTTQTSQPETSASVGSGVEVEIGSSYDFLNNGFDDWREYYLSISKRFTDGKGIYGSFRQARLFALNDQELLIGFQSPLSPRWSGLVEASMSPSHRVLAKWSLYGQLKRTIGENWGVQFGLGHTEYSDARFNTGALTVERNWERYRAAYTLSANQLPGAGTGASHLAQVNHYYGDGSSVVLSAAFGQEVDNLGPVGTIRTDVRGFSVGGRHWFLTRWAITYQAGLYRQGDFFTRQSIRLGLRHRF